MALIFTETDLENAQAALASGALEVQIGDRRVKYRSQDELLALIRMIEQNLEGAESDNPTMVKATFSRGGK